MAPGIERSFERPWGAGIMYESGLPIPLYTGCKKIITIGWDIGVLKKEDEGKKHIRYDHFYAKGKDGEKTAYDGINVKKMPVGGSAGMSYEDTKRVIDSTEDLHKFMESIGVDFSMQVYCKSCMKESNIQSCLLASCMGLSLLASKLLIN